AGESLSGQPRQDRRGGPVHPQLKSIPHEHQPMSTNIKIPKLGMSMDEAKLVEWLVEDGAQVAEGAPLYEIETDKATQEVEAPASGTLKIIEPKGETYEVGHLIATIE